MAHSMTPELRLMVAPARTYAVLARQPSPVGPFTAFRRPLIAAVVLGVSIAIAGTGRVTPSLVLSTTLAWSFVVVLQVAIALPLIAGPARHTVGVPRALDLFFASHAAWSFFLLGAAVLGRSTLPVLLVAVVPVALTSRMVAAFFCEVLRLDRPRALARTVLHQAMTWCAFVFLYGSAVALPARVAEWLRW
jgi:hypothetical protein